MRTYVVTGYKSIVALKTVLVQFKKSQFRNKLAKGNGKFDFLGFTHHRAKLRSGFWYIKRKTIGKLLCGLELARTHLVGTRYSTILQPVTFKYRRWVGDSVHRGARILTPVTPSVTAWLLLTISMLLTTWLWWLLSMARSVSEAHLPICIGHSRISLPMYRAPKCSIRSSSLVRAPVSGRKATAAGSGWGNS